MSDVELLDVGADQRSRSLVTASMATDETADAVSQRLAPYIEAIRDVPTTDRAALLQELKDELGLARLPTQEEIKSSLVERFLTPSKRFPDSWLADYAVHWDADPLLGLVEGRDGRGLPDLLYAAPGETTTTLEFVTAGLEGRIVGTREVC